MDITTAPRSMLGDGLDRRSRPASMPSAACNRAGVIPRCSASVSAICVQFSTKNAYRSMGLAWPQDREDHGYIKIIRYLPSFHAIATTHVMDTPGQNRRCTCHVPGHRQTAEEPRS